MPTATLADDPIPILRGIEEDRIRRVRKMCRQLEVMFHDLSLIQNVVALSVSVLRGQNYGEDLEVSDVLRRCADDKIHDQLLRITKIVRKLGGSTNYGEESADVNA